MVDQVRILEIPAVSPIPTLSTWVPIQRNILPGITQIIMIICFTFLIHKEGLLNKEKLCAITLFFALDKETPTNIPYFGDEVIEKDTHFIESMVEEVYLVNHEEEKFNLTDDVFMKLIAAVNSYREEGLFSSTNTYIYYSMAIFSSFPPLPPY